MSKKKRTAAPVVLIDRGLVCNEHRCLVGSSFCVQKKRNRLAAKKKGKSTEDDE